MSRTLIKMLPLVALAGVLAGCGAGSKSAQNNTGAMSQTAAPVAGTVIATVNGEAITEPELNAYVMLRTHGAKIHLTDEQRYQIAQQLVQLTLAYQAAQKEGITKDPDVQAGLALQQKLYLANQVVEHYMNTAQVPDSILKTEYAAMVKAQSGEEYKARHILVKSEAEARKIIKELDHGANFAKLAAKDSTDKGSAKQGGELGWFKPQQMVPEFSAAVAELKPGHYTEKPVKSQFGWHVILLEQERTAAPPSYTASKPTLARQARDTMMRDYLDKMHSEASINMMIPNPASVAVAARVRAAASAAAAISAAAPKSAAVPSPATH